MNRDASDDAFGDAVYDAWRRGGNPDLVDRDRIADSIAEGCSREEAADREVERVTRRRVEYSDEC